MTHDMRVTLEHCKQHKLGYPVNIRNQATFVWHLDVELPPEELAGYVLCEAWCGV